MKIKVSALKNFKNVLEEINRKYKGVRKMKMYKYSCDGGTIKIGNDDFSVHITNDYGDGTHKVYIGTEKEIFDRKPYDAKYVGSVRGKFNIYEYDCGNEVLCKLEGRYSVYKHAGTIYLIKWE